MPLTLEEKEKIRDDEILKEEIRKELQAAPKTTSRLSDFQKRIFLLFIGFVLTGVVGGVLTELWKSRELSNERTYLAQQRALDKAYSLIDETSKQVAVTLAAADDVLSTYYGSDWTSDEIQERRTNWTKTSRDWRINSWVLREDIASTFLDKQIDDRFQQIIQKRVLLGNIIVNLPKGKSDVSERELKNQLDQAIRLKVDIAELLHKCSARMRDLARNGATH